MIGQLIGIGVYLVALPFLPAQAAALVLLALTAFAVMQPSRLPGPRQFGFLYSLLAFVAAQILAAIRSPAPAQSTAVLSFFLPGLVLFFIMMEQRSWPLRYWAFIWTAFGAALSLSVVIGWARLQMGEAVPADIDVPQAALFLSGNQMLLVPNDICAAGVLLALPLSLLLTQGAGKLIRAAALAAILLTLFAMTILRTRTGLAIACVEILVFGLAWRPSLLLALPAGLGLVAAADTGLRLHLLQRLLLDSTLQNHGIVGRLGLWTSALGMFSTAWLVGHGAQSFGPAHRDFLPAWAPPFPERRVLWAHSLYLETLAEQGLAGIVALLCLLLHPAWTLWHFHMKQKVGRSARLGGIAAASALIGFALGGALEFSFTRRVVPLILFGLLGFAWRACDPLADMSPNKITSSCHGNASA